MGQSESHDEKPITYKDCDILQLYGIPTSFKYYVDQKNRDDISVALLYMTTCCYNYHRGNYSEKAISLLQNGADPNVIDCYKMTPLCHVLNYGAFKANTKLVNKLLECGANPNVIDHSGTTPLYRVVNSESSYIVELVDKLLEYGADVNMGQNGYTPLSCVLTPPPNRGNHKPSKEKEIERSILIDKLLEHKADLGIKDPYGNTILMNTVRTDYHEARYNEIVINLCNRCNKSIIDEQNNDGTTALMNSIRYNKSKVTAQLITLNADIHIYNNEGLTALDFAINFTKNPTYIMLLLNQYSKENNCNFLTENFVQYLEQISQFPFMDHLRKKAKNTRNNKNTGGYCAIVKYVYIAYKQIFYNMINDVTTEMHHSFCNEYADMKIFDIVCDYLV